MKNLGLLAISIIIGLVIAMQFKSKPVVVHNTEPEAFSFSLDTAPPASLKGNITNMTGEVSWQSRTATEASIINSPQIIQQGEELDTKDKATVVFANVAEINLSNAQVYFAQTLPVDLVLQQKTGTVDYKKLGNSPVSVRVLHALVEILGDTTIKINDDIVTISGKSQIAFNNLQNVSQVRQVAKSFVFNDSTRRGK